MKFKIDCAEFLKTLTHLQGIVDKKNSLPILSNILIEASANELTLSSTDMDISIIEKIDCFFSESHEITSLQALVDVEATTSIWAIHSSLLNKLINLIWLLIT